MQIRVLRIVQGVGTTDNSVMDMTGDTVYTRGGGQYIGRIHRDWNDRRPPTGPELARLLPRGVEFVAEFEDVRWSKDYRTPAEVRQAIEEAGDVAPELRALFDANDRHTACRLAVARQTWPIAQILRGDLQ